MALHNVRQTFVCSFTATPLPKATVSQGGATVEVLQNDAVRKICWTGPGECLSYASSEVDVDIPSSALPIPAAGSRILPKILSSALATLQQGSACVGWELFRGHYSANANTSNRIGIVDGFSTFQGLSSDNTGPSSSLTSRDTSHSKPLRK